MALVPYQRRSFSQDAEDGAEVVAAVSGDHLLFGTLCRLQTASFTYRLESWSHVLNRNVADDGTVAIKVQQGRRPEGVANTSSVSAARIFGPLIELEGARFSQAG